MATTCKNRDKITKVTIFLLSFLLSPSSITFTSSFTIQHHETFSPRHKHHYVINHRFHSRPRTSAPIPLRAVIDPPSRKSAGDHMDDKRKGKKDENSNKNNSEERIDEKEDEWTQVNGGFLPKFLRRQRKQQKNPSTSTTSDRPKHMIPNVISIDNIIDYKTVVVDEEESIVVVRFFASWCKSCRASEPFFRNIVSRYVGSLPQRRNENFGVGDAHRRPVKFVQVQLTRKTAYLQEGLGVPSVPFVHVYHPEAGLVEERKFSKKYMAEFAEVLESYVVGSCDLSLDEEMEETEGKVKEGGEDGDIYGVFE